MPTNKDVGNLGEDISVKHLVKLKYTILDRNFRRPWGEIDVVASKDETIHFIEVKTVTFSGNLSPYEYMPEDNVHDQKLQRLHRVIKTYLGEKNVSDSQSWQVDIMAVFLDLKQKKAKIRITEDI